MDWQETLASEITQEIVYILHTLKSMGEKKHDIKPSEMMVVMHLQHHAEGLSPSEISEELGYSRSALTAILNSLEAKGYVTRTLSTEDRRKLIIRVTERMNDKHQHMHQRQYVLLHKVMERMGEDDVRALSALLRRAAEALKEINGAGSKHSE